MCNIYSWMLSIMDPGFVNLRWGPYFILQGQYGYYHWQPYPIIIAYRHDVICLLDSEIFNRAIIHNQSYISDSDKYKPRMISIHHSPLCGRCVHSIPIHFVYPILGFDLSIWPLGRCHFACAKNYLNVTISIWWIWIIWNKFLHLSSETTVWVYLCL